MSQSLTSISKVCATCTYWDGDRELTTYGDRVTVENSMCTGMCLNRACSWWRYDRQAMAGPCNKYEKWPVLR